MAKFYNAKYNHHSSQMITKWLIAKINKLFACEVCYALYLSSRKNSRFCSRKCQHISQSQEFKDGRFDGKNNPFYGKSHKKESIEKMIKSLPDRKLESHWNWQGGISFKPYPIGWSKTYKEQIRYRDGYACNICGTPEVECSRKLHVHHIDYNKDNLSSENLISLCMSCHFKTNYNRNQWVSYFKTRRKDVKVAS